MVARTRSRLSRTAISGRPTMSNRGRPVLMSASTVTEKASSPFRPKLSTFAYIITTSSPDFLLLLYTTDSRLTMLIDTGANWD